MGVFFNVFLTIISVIVFGFLIITSLFIENEDGNESTILLESLNINIDKLKMGFNYKSFNYLDEVFYSTGKILEVNNGNIINIELSSGEYIFSLSGVDYIYNITYKGFSIKNIGPGKFYINTLYPDKYSIFSISSVINIELRDTLDNKFITDVFLYPHGYIQFDPTLTYLVEGGDLLKVSSVLGGIGYFNNNIITGLGILSEDFSKIFTSFHSDDKFISNILNIYYDNNNKLSKKSLLIKNEGEKSILERGKINEYVWLLLNKEKMKSFELDIIFSDLNNMFFSTKKDMKLVNKIYSNINKLDGKVNGKLELVLYNYFKLVSMKSNEWSKINYYELFYLLDENKNNFIPPLFYLNYIYNSYTFNSAYNIYSNLTLFNKEYFNRLGIKISNYNTSIKEIDFSVLDYFSFFLQNLLLNHDSLDKDTISKIISLFEYYTLLDNNLYGNQTDEKIKTGIINHLKVLENISTSIVGYYFKPKRDTYGRLVKNNVGINISDIAKLKRDIDNLIKFFNESMYVFTEGSQEIKDYNNVELKLDEYFKALLNYEKYKLNYFNEGSLITRKVEIKELSYDKAYLFMNYFEGINIRNIKIELKSDYYSISDLLIDDININFKLYPYRDNLIDDIYVNGNLLDGSYVLGESINEELVILPYVLPDYLVKIFTTTTTTTTTTTNNNKYNNNYIYEKYNYNPSSYELSFIREELLGDKGEFSKLKGILDMGISNIIAIKNNGWDISIYNTLLTLFYTNNTGVKASYNILFSSDYLITNDGNYFDNIKMNIIDGKMLLSDINMEKINKLLLYGNDIIIKGKINIDSFEKSINNIGTSINNILFILDIIENIFSIKDLDIRYSLPTKKILIKFNYLGEKITISSTKSKINFIFYKQKNILDGKIELDKLEESLINLK